MKKKSFLPGRSWRRHKIPLAMKLSAFLLFCGVLQANATLVFSQHNKLTLQVNNSSLDSVFRAIENNSDYSIFYKQGQLDVTKKINVNAIDCRIETLLTEVLKGTNTSFTIADRHIVIIPNSKSSSSFTYSNAAAADDITIKGIVTDRNGQPLPGVSIVVKGSKNGVITDGGGHFSIKVPNTKATLVFSFIGYSQQEVAVGNKVNLSVALDDDHKKLDEVVVIGYGSVRKTDVTSAISSISEKDFNRGAVVSPMQLIQGKVPGLVIVNNQGNDPNGQSSVQLRGISSVKGSGGPLIVIDGIPGGNLNNLSPEDIASMDVLRDGSAAAIYGTRGTNGVIIITTKRAKNGAATVNYDGYAYTDQVYNFPRVLTADEYRAYAEEYKKINPTFVLNDGGANTDWFKVLTKKPFSQVHNISVSGGTEKSNIRAAVSYRNLDGIAIETWRKIVNTRVSFTQKAIDDKLTIQGNFATSFLQYNKTDNTIFGDAVGRNPTFPVFNPDGSYFEDPADRTGNPYARRMQTEDGERIKHLNGSIKATLALAPGLNASGFFAMQRRDVISYYYQSRDAWQSKINGQNGNANRSTAFDYDRTFEYTIDYAKTIGRHNITGLAGYSYQDFMSEGFNVSNQNFLTDAMSYNNLGAGQAFKATPGTGSDLGSSKSSSKLIAFFGRAIYSYDDRLLLSASVRREGSSKFGRNNKWGWFPAVNAGWRVSKESFFPKGGLLEDLKIRAGFGITGNQGLGSYASLQTLTTGAQFLWNGAFMPTYGASNSSNPNPDLRWEKKAEYNFGIDFTLRNSRLSGSIDIYNRRTSDLLLDATAPVPSQIAQTSVVNLGVIRNTGVELALNANIIERKKFSWNNSFTFSYNKNLLVSTSYGAASSAPVDHYSLPNNMGNAFRRQAGQPIGNFYGRVFKDFDETQGPGKNQWLFYTKADDSTLDGQGKKIIGNGLPKMFISMTNNFSYGRWDLSVFLRGSFMFDILNITDMVYMNKVRFSDNFLKKALDQPINGSYAYSNYFLEKGDFVKLDNVTLGYTFNTSKIKYLRKARLYVSGQNLLTFTSYTGRDPDIEVNGLEPGIGTMNFYPRTRTFTVGVNVGF